MNPERFLFSMFAAMAIISASGVVVLRDPVKCALSLVACFFSIACLYLLQAAELIAVLEVLVYAGAIMVLYLFVIMLLNLKPDELKEEVSRRRKILSFGASVALFCLIAGAIRNSEKVTAAPSLTGDLPSNASPAALGAGEIGPIATELFMEHGLAFELTSVLILIAIIGAIYLTKKRPVAKHGTTES